MSFVIGLVVGFFIIKLVLTFICWIVAELRDIWYDNR